MGRTVPSFRTVLEMEKQEWKTFRNALDKSERKEFDQMWDIPQLYVSACSNSCQLVPLQPIMISILFHHYKELKECISEVKRMIGPNSIANDMSSSTKKIDWLREKEEEQKQDEGEVMIPITLDGYFL